ncbi:TPA: hypothetical protein PXE77_005403, partial [Pseudomonas aeruginosa]|nr:hypothetical protein [Pseudomonas aeruginosa]
MSSLEYEFGENPGAINTTTQWDSEGRPYLVYSFLDRADSTRLFSSQEAARLGYEAHRREIAEDFDTAAGIFTDAYEGAVGYLISNTDSQGRIIIDRGAINSFNTALKESWSTLTDYGKTLHKFGPVVPLGKTVDLAKAATLFYEGRTGEAIESLAKSVVSGGASAVGAALAAGLIASATAAGMISLAPIGAALLVGGAAALAGWGAEELWDVIKDEISDVEENDGEVAFSIPSKTIARLGTGVSDVITIYAPGYTVEAYGNGGDDDIHISGTDVKASGGEGNDRIEAYGSLVTVEGGKGDDTIYTNKLTTIHYNEGDGFDEVYGGGEAIVKSDLNLLGITVRHFSDGLIVDYNGEHVINLKYFRSVEFEGMNNALINHNYYGYNFSVDMQEVESSGPVNLTVATSDSVHIHRRSDPQNADIINIQDSRKYLLLDNQAVVILNPNTPPHVIEARDSIGIRIDGASIDDITLVSSAKGEFVVEFHSSGNRVQFVSAELQYNLAQSTTQIEFSDGTIWAAQDFIAKLSELSDRNGHFHGGDADDDLNITVKDPARVRSYRVDGGGGNDNITLHGGNGWRDFEVSGGAGTDTYNIGANTRVVFWEAVYSGEEINFLGQDARDLRVVEDGGRYLISSPNSWVWVEVAAPNFKLNGISFEEITSGTFSFALNGGESWDNLDGGIFKDVIDGGGGNDRIHGHAGDDVLVGGSGDDNIWGGGGSDRTEGGAGADFLNGEDGDDSLDGGSGNDFMDGGAGSDNYYFNQGGGVDTIEGRDTSSGKVDRVFFGVGFTERDIVFTQSADRPRDLQISFSGSSDVLYVAGFFIDEFGYPSGGIQNNSGYGGG